MTTSTKRSINRRSFFGVTGAVAAATIAGGFSASAAADRTAQVHMSGRRKLGSLEVSSVGLGVQNMSRKYETTVPYRPEMINIIRAAYDHGVTFFDTAEAYGPLECERILGESIAAIPQQSCDHLEAWLEYRPRDRQVPDGAQQQA